MPCRASLQKGPRSLNCSGARWQQLNQLCTILRRPIPSSIRQLDWRRAPHSSRLRGPARPGVIGRAAHLALQRPKLIKHGLGCSRTIGPHPTSSGFLGRSAVTPCNIRGSCRWGDYSSTQIDRLAPTDAWSFNQLVRTGSLGGSQSQFNWNTRRGRDTPGKGVAKVVERAAGSEGRRRRPFCYVKCRLKERKC